MIIYPEFIDKYTIVLWIHNNDTNGTSGFGHYSVIKLNFNFPDPLVPKYDPTISVKEILGGCDKDKEVCEKCFVDDYITANCELSSDLELSEAQIKELEKLPTDIEIVINEKKSNAETVDKKPDAEVISENITKKQP
jgi:hypothetical protein